MIKLGLGSKFGAKPNLDILLFFIRSLFGVERSLDGAKEKPNFSSAVKLEAN
jgi:hypothetical protein